MIRALNAAATGMAAQQLNIDVVANNIANVNTTGFRRSRAEFQDLLYQTLKNPGGQAGSGAPVPVGVQVGLGTRVVATQAMHIQGGLRQTGNNLDLAIEGQGFFQVMRPNQEIAYSRAGNFKTDADGRLVTADGFAVEPAITIPVDATSVSVSTNGVVSVTQPGQANAVEVGQLQLVNFANPAGLLEIGRSMFQLTSASGQPLTQTPGENGVGTISQGFLEGSNVEVVNEMIDLIASQRAYEVNQRVVQAADEMLSRVSQR
jgi:flagellar basal-body rod protein FlgG